jgi:membrane-bound lytic murein transglycosylase D
VKMKRFLNLPAIPVGACIVFLAVGTLGSAAFTPPRKVADPTLFPTAGFEARIEFWEAVFASHGENDYVLHDPDDLRLIYRVVSTAGVPPSERSAYLRKQREEVERTLRRIGEQAEPAADAEDEQRRLSEMLSRLGYRDRGALEQLAGRLRYQRGIKERFREGLVRAGRYLPMIREIFERHGLPEELSALPHVESSFNYNAYSKVGAAGIWQFMPSTAKRFLSMNSVMDERLDPVRASEAAALLLKENYRVLGNWPLAITAYNHGQNGMRRARDLHGDDLRVIIARHQSPIFGFASKNFYAEFLAAIRVTSDPQKYFGPLRESSPVRFEKVKLDRSVSMKQLLDSQPFSAADVRDLNPHLRDAVWKNRVPLPAGLDLRVPPGVQLARLPELPESRPAPGQTAASAAAGERYRVRSGDTLGAIAARNKVSVRGLKAANGLSGDRIHPGQILRIPASPVRVAEYKVKSGDNLTTIAKRFGTSAKKIEHANRISNPRRLLLGQMLVIPLD